MPSFLQPIGSFLASIDAGIRNLFRSLFAAPRPEGMSSRTGWEMNMRGPYKQFGKINLFPVISVLLAVYFFYSFAVAIGVPPAPSLDWTSLLYLALAVFFFLLPELQRFQLSKLHEYETRLDDAKGEVLLLRSEIRTLMSAYNGLLASTGMIATHASDGVLPTPDDADEARQNLNAVLGEVTDHKQLDAEIEHFLDEEDFDLESALWDLRKVMDKELRRVLNFQGGSRPLSSRSLCEDFVRLYPEYEGIHAAFDYVLQVCEAAAHGREIQPACAQEAFQMGLRILGALRKITPAAKSSAA